MIRFDKFGIQYPQAQQPALHNASLSIADGAFTLVIGASGSGKSTLLRAINGLVPHFTGGSVFGRVTTNGVDPIALGPQQMSAHVGFVFQNPDAQFVTDRVEDEIAFTLENAALPRQKMSIRVEEALDLLELSHLRRRRIDTLSGGQRQRAAIASAIALRPRILVLDEPTSQLDPKSADDVLQALLRLNHDLGLTIVLSEHRLERVAPFADQVVQLAGPYEPIVVGTARDVLATAQLAPAVVRVARRMRWAPLPLSVKEGRAFAARMRITAAPRRAHVRDGAAVLIEARAVEAGYGATRALHEASLTLRRGEIVCMLGRNGSGKSTLLKCLIGLVRPTHGRITIDGRDTSRMSIAEAARSVAYVPQDPGALLFAETVADELRITLRNHGRTPTPEHIARTLEQFELAHLAEAYPRDLSAGERQRTALAALCVTQPQALLLDEPTHGLDYAAKQNLTRILHSMRDRDAAILCVTHDVEFAAALADRTVLMSEGRVLYDGAPDELLAHSPLFATQTARLFPDSGCLIPEDVHSVHE